MGRHQRAESAGLVAFLFCAVIGLAGMSAYVQYAPAIWQVGQRLFTVASAITAFCGTASFIVGYSRKSRSLQLKQGWLALIRRVVEVFSLSIVYASTLFFTSFMVFGVLNQLMGKSFTSYMTAMCAGFAGVSGYVTYVQAELMSSKTIASLLPFFVVSGVSTAGLTTDDPYWYNNNFSQLGDRTTFAARMFNATLILAGVCIIIISYFAISELLTNYRMRQQWPDTHGESNTEAINHFKARITILAITLTIAGIAFIGIGTFRYTPHPIMHNVFARGLPVVMGVLFLALPWLAPQFSKAMYTISILALVVCGVSMLLWLQGLTSMTNVEALAGMMFLGWFIVFSRQIAAMEADRLQTQLLHAQSAEPSSPSTADIHAALEQEPQSRLEAKP